VNAEELAEFAEVLETPPPRAKRRGHATIARRRDKLELLADSKGLTRDQHSRAFAAFSDTKGHEPSELELVEFVNTFLIWRAMRREQR
jgi:hypothetical protein